MENLFYFNSIAIIKRETGGYAMKKSYNKK